MQLAQKQQEDKIEKLEKDLKEQKAEWKKARHLCYGKCILQHTLACDSCFVLRHGSYAGMQQEWDQVRAEYRVLRGQLDMLLDERLLVIVSRIGQYLLKGPQEQAQDGLQRPCKRVAGDGDLRE